MVKNLLKALLLLLISGTVFSAYAQSAPGGFTGSATGTTITLTWTPETGGSNTGYIIKAKRNPGGAFPATPAYAALPISNDADLTDGQGMIEITNENTGSYNAFTNIVAGAQYDFEIFTYDNNSFSTAAATTVYTLATAPGAFPAGFTFTATVNGAQIDLAFTKASKTPMDAHGYLILRRNGNNPDLTGISDGSAPGGTYHIFTVIDSTSAAAGTTYTDNSAIGGVTYHYALVPYRVGFNMTTPINQTYNYGGLSTFQTATIPLVTTIDEITGGVDGPVLSSSSTTQAILGFSVVSNGAPNFTAINIQTTSNAAHKFTNAYLYESANNSFGGGDTPVGSVSDNLTATQIQLSGFSVGLSSTPKYFFIVVDVQDTVSASSPTLTPSFTNANISISGGGTVTVNSSPLTGEVLSFVDNSPPTISSRSPAHGSGAVSVVLTTLSITFNEPVAYVGDNSNDANRIRIWDDDANAFVETINMSDVSVAGNVVTFITDFDFDPDTDYDIVIGNSVFEDLAGNDFPGIAEDNWEFHTEQSPSITMLSTITRCIGDVLTITGARFTGTGGSGNTKPTVRINGNVVHADSITSFSSTSITLVVPPNATTGNVTVENEDNDLNSNGSAITIRPRIRTGLTVVPATLNPAQNTSVNIDIGAASPAANQTQSSYTYALTLESAAPGYTLTEAPPVAHSASGNDNKLTLNTSEGPDNTLDFVGVYVYRIDVSRSGCTTRPLATKVTLEVVALDVTVTATDTTVCIGTNPILIGATSGGTGFYQFSWVGPNGFTSTNSSPTPTFVHPASTGWYILTLSDNSLNTAKDSVFIETFAPPVANIVPNPTETSVRNNYVLENRDYLVTGSPAGGVFTGPGIVLKNDNNYYFNPSNAGLGNHLVTYTYTDANGCQDSDTDNFVVQSLTVNGVEQLYCLNRISDTGIQVNIANAIRPGFQFTRLRFYSSGYYDNLQSPAVVGVPSNSLGASIYPLEITSVQTVNDIQTLTSTQIPNLYTLHIDRIRANFGFGNYYLDVFAKNALGQEVLQTWAFFRVVDNGPIPSIVGINQNENVCADASPIVLSSSVVGYTVTDFDITAGFEGALSGTNERDFNPGHSSLTTTVDERALLISMDYNDFNGCPNTVSRNFTWVKKPNAPNAPDVSYCKITTGIPASFTINSGPNGSGTNPYWYGQDPIANPTTPILDSVNFNGFVAPGITGLAATQQTFYVTQNYKGCEGAVEPVNIEIREAPNATITTQPVCEDRLFTVSGPEQSSGVPYLEYQWSFDDGYTVTTQNDSTETHNYGPGTGNTSFTIGLIVKNSLQCTNSSTLLVSVGLNPQPDFTYQLVCDGDDTHFDVIENNITVTQFEWDFGDGTTVGPNTTDDIIDHPFAGPGEYDVTLTTYTGLGCSNSETKTISILEYLPFTSGSPYSMAAVDNGRGFWKLEDIAGNSTWDFGIVDKFTENAWATSLAGDYLSNEESFLNSPCFDIEDIDRPVLSLDFTLNTDENRDGIALEYSKDGGVTWFPLGNVNSGFNWFNTTGFFGGNIGSSPVGWSGDSKNLADNDNIQILKDSVVQGRRALDNLLVGPGALLPADRAKVRFRIAFKSDGLRELDGFSFNNVKIESRNRTLLVENFTNEEADNYTSNNTQFISISTQEAVKIQYHVGAPGEDPNYPINTADPSARAAYYGIPLTNQYIPRGYVDGFSNGNFTLNGNPVTPPWVQNRFSQRSLKVAPYTLTVQSVATTPAEAEFIKISVDIEALEPIPSTRKPILHIGLVEKTVDANTFVLRKLIPSATGRLLTSPVAPGPAVNITESIRVDNPDIDISNLSIIAFIQDEITREVYQASMDLNPANLPQDIITGVEDPDYAKKIDLFPNPANDELNILLPANVTRETSLNLVDTYGRAVYQGSFAAGENRKRISTTELTGGVYIVQINTPEGGVARKKVMVVHH